jgi:hypothetical protein
LRRGGEGRVWARRKKMSGTHDRPKPKHAVRYRSNIKKSLIISMKIHIKNR